MSHQNVPDGIDLFEAQKLVYVRPISADEVQAILPANALEMIDAVDDLFAVHDARGNRLAIIEGRDAAFEAARSHALQPASLH